MSKRILIIVGVLLVLLQCTASAASIPTTIKIKEKTISDQQKRFDEIVKEFKSGKRKVQQDKDTMSDGIITFGTTGSYPTRKGVMLVTDGLKVDSLVGHAGMVMGPNWTLESFPEGGVQYRYDNWTTRYRRVWGVSTYGTTTSQDANVADFLSWKRGLPYNRDFADIHVRHKFYCSQLVYAGYIDLYGIDINHGGWIVFPADIIDDNDTYTLYTYVQD